MGSFSPQYPCVHQCSSSLEPTDRLLDGCSGSCELEVCDKSRRKRIATMHRVLKGHVWVMQIISAEGDDKRRPSSPKGIPAESPTAVLTGPCAA